MSDESEPLNREGAWAQQAEANLGDRRLREEIERGLAFGLRGRADARRPHHPDLRRAASCRTSPASAAPS